MEDHDLSRLLRELPPEPAREGFTARVLARLDARPEPSAWRRPRLILAGFAAAALMAVLTFAGILQVREHRAEMRKAEARRILQELRTEHDSLQRELRALSSEPVVYLGGNERVDLVVDLSRVQNARF